uniref:Uncharacterized protein n=1 Tax=Plectus sambesii TaxID=2011161 RepID=A0A914XN63_9BILA
MTRHIAGHYSPIVDRHGALCARSGRSGAVGHTDGAGRAEARRTQLSARGTYRNNTRAVGRCAVRRKPAQTTATMTVGQGEQIGDGRDDVHALSSGAVGSNVNIRRGRATVQLPLISRRPFADQPTRPSDGRAPSAEI